MNAKDLIGKRALRTKPVDYKNGHHDWSYTGGSPVTIVNVTESHITIRNIHGLNVLDSRWNDDNWQEYEAIVQRN